MLPGAPQAATGKLHLDRYQRCRDEWKQLDYAIHAFWQEGLAQ